MFQKRLLAIASQIHQSFDTPSLLHAAVVGVRKYLVADRVLILQFTSEMKALVVAEDRGEEWTSTLGQQIDGTDTWQASERLNLQAGDWVFERGDVLDYSGYHLEGLQQFEVKSCLAVPILLVSSVFQEGSELHTTSATNSLETSGLDIDADLWGLLVVHQCRDSRHWLSAERDFLLQIAGHLAIALQQSITLGDLQQSHQKLWISERRYATLSSIAPVGIFHLDIDLHCIYFNLHSSLITGIPIETALSEGWMQCIHPDDCPQIRQQFRQIPNAYSTVLDDFRCLRKDAGIVWIRCEILAQYDEQSELIGFIGTFTDVTDRKLLELELQAQKALLETVINTTSSMIFVKNLQHQYVLVNPSFAGAIGRAVDEILGKTDAELNVPPQEATRYRQENEQVLYSRSPLSTEVEKVLVAGKEVWEQWHKFPVILADGGSGVVGVGVDVTDHRLLVSELEKINQDLERRVQERTVALNAAQTVLQERERQFRTVVENAPDAIMRVNAQHQYLYVNPQIEVEFGIPVDDYIGKSIYDMGYDNALVEKWYHIDQQVLETGELQTSEFKVDTETGTKHYQALSVPELDESGVPQSVLTMIRNITPLKQAEEALFKSNALFNAVIEAAPLSIDLIAPDGTVLLWNPTAERIFGWKAEEVIGRYLPIITDDVKPEFEQWLRNGLEGQILTRIETRRQKKDGNFIDLRLSTAPVFDAEGACLGVVALGEDVTQEIQIRRDRAWAEAALRRSEARLHQLMDANIVGIFFAGSHQQVLEANQAFLDFIQYSREDLNSGHLFWDRLLSSNYKSLGSHLIQQLHEGEHITPVEVEFSCSDGRQVPAILGITRLSEDEGYLDIAFVLDITSRVLYEAALQQSKEALRQSQSRYQRLVSNVPGAIFLYKIEPDRRSEFLYISPKCEDLWNLSAEAIMRDAQVLWQQIQEDDLLTLQRSLTNVVAWTLEIRVTSPIGLKWFQISAEPEYFEDGSVYWDGIFTDISDRKESERQIRRANESLVVANAELARANQMKDEFLANMSHELRTPLNSVLIMAEMLNEEVYGSLNKRQHRCVSTIQTSGQHLLALISNILDLAKVDAGSLELHFTEVPIQKLIEDSLTFIQNQAQLKKIEIHCLLERVTGTVKVDERRMQQVLINLLSNAVKFTPGGGNITLELTENYSNQTIKISVIDTGIGIETHQLERLFQPFVQLETSLDRQYEGTGLGLALVRQLVALHNGRVEVESTPGQGSCFSVILQYNQALSSRLFSTAITGDNGIVPASEDLTATVEQASSPIILLAEDNIESQENLLEYLESKGYRVITANNGREAVEQAQRYLPQIILMDVQMPEMDGLEAIRMVRANPVTAHLHIIALTALAMVGDRDRCLAAGADDYVTKPMQLKQLMELIRGILNRAKN